jgi:2-polyprenyl-3-methyl-5-hydroxy-6-metoxy-1,4-benzoquinol methylase
MFMNNSMVQRAYDEMAIEYVSGRDELKTKKYLKLFTNLLRKNSTILDLGCGAGVPVDDVLVKQGFYVVGIDISTKMIELASKNCKGCEYRVADIQDLKYGEYSVGGIICLYTMFHLPRNKHAEILRVMASFLPINGPLLISMGDREWEGVHTMYGQKVWASQWGIDKNLQLVKNAGFEIIFDTIDKSGRESHQIILAIRKK